MVSSSRRFLAALAGAALLTGCGSGPVAGPGSETSGIDVVVMREGRPAVGAKVQAWNPKSWSDSVAKGRLLPLDEEFTNDLGQVRLEGLPALGRVVVEANQPGWSQTSDVWTRGLQPISVALERAGALRVSIRHPEPILDVRVWATGVTAQPAQDGRWILAPLPQGLFRIVVRTARGLWFAGRAEVRPADTADVIFDLPVDRMELLDTLHPEAQNPIGALFGNKSGWWFVDQDSGAGFVPDVVTQGISAAMSIRGLEVSFVAEPTSIALVGFDFGIAKDSHDLSGMDSIVLEANGNGQIEFQVTCFAPDGRIWRLVRNLSIPSVRQKIAIRPSDFMVRPADEPPTGSAPVMDTLLRRATSVVFVATRNADLRLRSLTVHGIGQSDLYPRLRP